MLSPCCKSQGNAHLILFSLENKQSVFISWLHGAEEGIYESDLPFRQHLIKAPVFFFFFKPLSFIPTFRGHGCHKLLKLLANLLSKISWLLPFPNVDLRFSSLWLVKLVTTYLTLQDSKICFPPCLLLKVYSYLFLNYRIRHTQK